MSIRSFIASLSPPARIALWGGLGLIVLLTAIAMWMLFGTRQQLLFGNLREAEAAEIVQALDEWKVSYEIIDSGSAITVAADEVYNVRMRLVSAGVPKGGHVGFELFNDADFGVTEFAQRVNYQRALQGELERTISSLPGVERARVHLTIRRPGLFVGETESSKASVALTLEPGQALDRQQVNGVRSLVAAAVEGLPVEQVSVLDSSGALLAGTNGALAQIDARGDEESRLEARLQQRVTDLLERALGDEVFHVAVDVRLNYDAVRQVSERPLTQGLGDEAVLVRKRVNSVDAAGGTGRSQNQEEAEYAHGTAREEISRAPGRVERISVAVMLPMSLDESEAERLRSLVAASTGLREERGDLLEVSRIASALAPARPSSAERPAAARQVVTAPVSGMGWKLGIVAALGLLGGAILVAATTRRPRRLSSDERDAAVVQLRGWLVDGTRVP